MNKALGTALVATLFVTATTTAQETKTSVDKKEEKKQIIIQEKSTNGKSEKMVIEINGDKVTINGKPADDYKGKKRIVIDDDISIDGDEVHIPRDGRMYFRGFGEDRAILGVVTDKDDKGARVKEVKKGTAAEKAGLKEGDIITKFNNDAVKSSEDLVAAVGKTKPNDAANVTYLRGGKESKVKATLGKSDAPRAMAWSMKGDQFKFKMDPPVAMVAPNGPHPFVFNDDDMWVFRSDRPRYGMSIEDNADGDGVKITAVDSASNAAKAGLKENDIITEVDGKSIKGTDELRDVLGDAEDKNTLTLKVLRNGTAETVTLRVPKVIKKADL